MLFAHYYDVDCELHGLKHRGELLPIRYEIMGKIGSYCARGRPRSSVRGAKLKN